MKNNISSTDIKYALMFYFRYKRQWICADEVHSNGFLADIFVDTNKYTMEVEVKISKSDLILGEAKKRTGWRNTGKLKHQEWNIKRANKFSLCVPEYLEDDAIKWIDTTNSKYGLYIYKNAYNIVTKKIAKLLHNQYNNINYKERLLKRLSSCRTLELGKIYNDKYNAIG